MRKLLITIFWLFISFSFLILIHPPVSAENEKGVASHIAIGIGSEQLSYKENVPDINLKSSATVHNWTLGFEGLKRLEHVFCGINGIIPAYRVDDNEKWIVSGTLNQTNSLQYGWTRIDAFLGWPLTPFFNPYLGLRWAEATQKRSDFVVLGTPVSGSAAETIMARFLMLGINGNVSLAPCWNLTYLISYFDPFYSKVTNSALPGWETSGKGGYTIEFKGKAEYLYTRRLSIVFLLYGGRMQWKGSDWESYGAGSVKWPENVTRYLGGMLNISWKF